MYKDILRKIAHFQVIHPFFTVLILIGFTVMIWGGISQVKTVASLEQMMPKNIEEIKAFNTLRDNYLGQDMIAIVFSVDPTSQYEDGIYDVRDKEMYLYLSKLKIQLEKESDIIGIYSFDDVINMYSGGSSGTIIDDDTYNSLISNDDIGVYLEDFVNDDYSTTIMILNSDIATSDVRMNMLAYKVKEIVSSVGSPSGIEIKYTGTPIVQQKLGFLIGEDRKNTQWISTLLVFIITMLIFRSFLSAVVPILVVFTSVNWLYGTMGYVSLPISTLAGGVAAMVIGIGIDFAIHIMNKFKYERKQGNPIGKSVELAVLETGVAIFITSLTTIAAFLAFLVGVMPEMGRFGLLMTIGIFYSLVFSLFGLPALLIIEEKIIYYVKNHMKFGIDDEFELKSKNIISNKLNDEVLR